jgi:fatty-acyl-CoA synthase
VILHRGGAAAGGRARGDEGSAGFDVTHVYGLTETYGPAVINDWKSDWDDLDRRPARRRRRGRACAIRSSRHRRPRPRDHGAGAGRRRDDGRGHVPRQRRDEGVPQEPKATDEAFAGGWFHSGDLGVLIPDGYIQLKDRSKDIIISGGENISSHRGGGRAVQAPGGEAAAVVAKPDDNWGETPCAFVELKPGMRRRPRRSSPGAAQIWRRFKAPKHGRLHRAAQDLDRQDPEVRAARAGEGGVRGFRGP